MTPPGGHDGPGMFWMFGRRRFMKPDSGPPNSGLTGGTGALMAVVEDLIEMVRAERRSPR